MGLTAICSRDTIPLDNEIRLTKGDDMNEVRCTLDDIPAQDMDLGACVSFVEEQILERTILDYKMLEAKGIVKDGKMIRPPKSQKEVVDYPNAHAVEYLLNFFKKTENIAFWLDLGEINIHPDAVKRGLGFALDTE
jgi:hypothetical protein